jgi:hypothetical protein
MVTSPLKTNSKSYLRWLNLVSLAKIPRKKFYLHRNVCVKGEKMSLTLRDAQHLSFKTFKKFEAADEKRSATIGTSADLIEKASEIAQKNMTEQNSENKEETGKLLSELLFSALVLAERRGISLEDVFLQTLDEIILGFVG